MSLFFVVDELSLVLAAVPVDEDPSAMHLIVKEFAGV